MVGHRRAAGISDVVEQPDDIGAGNTTDLVGPELGQHMALECAAPFGDAAQPTAFAGQIFVDDGVERVVFGVFGLTPRGQRIAAFSDGAEDGFGFPARRSQR